MFTQCDVIKNLAERYLLQRGNLTQYQFYNFVEFIGKTEVFVVVCK